MTEFLHQLLKRRDSSLDTNPWGIIVDRTMERERNLFRDYVQLSTNVWINREAPRTPMLDSGELSLIAQMAETRSQVCESTGMPHVYVYQGSLSGMGVTQHRFVCNNCLWEQRETMHGEGNY